MNIIKLTIMYEKFDIYVGNFSGQKDISINHHSFKKSFECLRCSRFKRFLFKIFNSKMRFKTK